MASKVIILSLL